MSDTTRKLATIVALDVAGYSARTEADEARTTAEVAALRKVIEAIAAKHGGRVFNTAGDGFMLEFGSSLAAVEAAIELAETCEPKVRVGVHLGDVMVQPNGDLLGHGVNVAARLMARSDPGGALISGAVRQSIRGPIAERLQSQGMLKLDKMAETIEAFALSHALSPKPANAAKAARLAADRWGIAVLPFVDQSSTRDQGYFLDALSEEISSSISPNNLFALAGAAGVPRDPSRDIAGIAASLGVRYVLDGSVRGAGAKLRVTARLVFAEAGAVLWQERFESGSDDGIGLEERIATIIAAQITTLVSAAENERVQRLEPAQRTALDWHTLAAGLSLDWRRESLEQAREYTLAALRLQPVYPIASVTLGWIYSVMYQSSWNEDPAETLRQGIESCARALNAAEHDPNVLGWYAAAHISFGLDLSVVNAMLTRAAKRNPDSELPLGWTLMCTGGQTAKSLELFRSGMARDPNSPSTAFTLLGEAACLFLLHRFEEAIPPAREAVVRRPEYMFAQTVLAACLAKAGQIDEARSVVDGLRGRGKLEIILSMFRNAGERAQLREALCLAGLDA